MPVLGDDSRSWNFLAWLLKLTKGRSLFQTSYRALLGKILSVLPVRTVPKVTRCTWVSQDTADLCVWTHAVLATACLCAAGFVPVGLGAATVLSSGKLEIGLGYTPANAIQLIARRS